MGLKILNFNIVLGFQKMNIFGVMKKLWILFWGSYIIGQFFGGGGEVIYIHFKAFFLNVNNLLGSLKFQIFFGYA